MSLFSVCFSHETKCKGDVPFDGFTSLTSYLSFFESFNILKIPSTINITPIIIRFIFFSPHFFWNGFVIRFNTLFVKPIKPLITKYPITKVINNPAVKVIIYHSPFILLELKDSIIETVSVTKKNIG